MGLRPAGAKEFDYLEQDPRFTGGEFNDNDPTHPNFWFYDQYTPARNVLQDRGVRLTGVQVITLPNLVRLSDAFYIPAPTNPSAATYPLTDNEIAVLKQYLADAPYTGGRSIIFNLSNGASAAMVNDLLSRLGLTGHMASDNVSGTTTFPLPNHPVLNSPLKVNSFNVANSGYFDSLGTMRSLVNVNGKAVLPYVEKGDLTPRSGGLFFLLDPDFVKNYQTESGDQQNLWVDLVDYVTQDQVLHYNPPPITATGPEIQVLDGATNIASGNSTTVDFGTTAPGTPVVKNFTVKNLGNATLTLGAMSALPTGFSVAQNFGNTSVAPGGTTTFQLQLNAAAVGSFSGQFNFINNDADEGPFVFNVQGLVSTPAATIYMDDGDPGFSTTGAVGSTVEAGRYYGDDHHFATGGHGVDAMTYTFTGLSPGIYRVSATWRGDTNRATNSPFVIIDGSTTLATVRVNQQNQPSSLNDKGFNWGDLGGPYSITSGTLIVRLSDDADQYVDADAIRVERVGNLASGPEIQVLDGTTDLTSGSSTVDFGTTAPGTPTQRTLTVKNVGNQALTLGTLATPPAGYSVVTGFSSTSLAPGTTATFTLQLDATSAGTFSGAQTFTNNDADEGNFKINLTGAVIAGGAVRILDDGDIGFATLGTWGSTYEQGRYYGNDHSFAKGGNGADQASYTFTNLTPGTYRVSATYRNDSNRATAVPYTISDGSSVLATATVNQQSQPSSLLDQGFSWTDLATGLNVSGTTLVVTIKDTADQFLYVDADAIRIERTGELGASPPPPPAPAQVFYSDDRGQGWTSVGSWGFTAESIYFNGGHSFAINGNGANVCTWNFTDLPAGKYRVSATWRGDYNRSTVSPFTIYDGASSQGTVIVNQQNQPGSRLDKGLAWGDLGTFTVTGSTLSVTLSDAGANGYVDADGIRIEKVE